MNLLDHLIDRLKTHRLTRDIAYTIGSFIFLAISGIVINIVIAGFRDASALGVFNQSYAVYIIASQLAVVGMHYSVLRHSAYYEGESEERGHLLATAGILALVMGVAGAGLIAATAPVFSTAFDSDRAGKAILFASTGLILFPLNKVILAYLNGLRHMRAFAILQSSRYLIVMVFVSTIAISSLPIELSTLSFVCAEIGTLLMAISYLKWQRLMHHLRFNRRWAARHFQFGIRSLVAGMFAEFNSRIDVLLIGVFLPDRDVGIYSFAAMLVDGLYHVLAMIRINFNPLLVSAMRDSDWQQAKTLLANSKRFVFPLTIVLAAVIALFYYIFTIYGISQKGLIEGLPSLVILLVALIFVSPFIPFDNLLLVVGHPSLQTLQQCATVGANVIFAMVFIPILGIEGAAIGTASSYFAGIGTLFIFSYYVVNWHLLTNKTRG